MLLNMTVARTRADSVFYSDGKIFVYEGTEDPVNWAEAFDLNTQTWKPLPISRPILRDACIMSAPRCFIENVNFSVTQERLSWYDSERMGWFWVEGLGDRKPVVVNYHAVRLANFGGKLVMLWHKARPLEFPVAGKTRKYLCNVKRIWCAVIRLEKRIGSSGLEMWGETQRLNDVLIVPHSYKILGCITL